VEQERLAWPRGDEAPFDAAVRRMVTLQDAPEGSSLVVCKGAPDAMVELLDGTEATRLAETRAAAERFMAGGHRRPCEHRTCRGGPTRSAPGHPGGG
jgi:Ca2+-transporting ATPase